MTTEHHTQAGALQLRSVTKIYDAKQGQHRAVDSINLDIEAGKFVTFLGPSGCGKTTTLRMIAGFEDVTEGEITLDGQSLVSVPPEKRPMSMVFQSYALFPHLTVKDNVGFGLNYQKLPAAEREQRIADGLALMGIEQYAHRYPHQLSGGQQQRVALARALVMEPKIILFDEPLSNLDARLRLRMRSEIRALQQRLGLTAIFVTHDQSEALTMSDMIVVMSAGTIEQVGEPREIYHRPVNRFVASFMGTASFVAGTVSEVRGDRYLVATPLGDLDTAGVPGLGVGDHVELVVRAENTAVGLDAPGNEQAGEGSDVVLEATVRSAAFDGSINTYVLDTAAGTLEGRSHGMNELHTAGEKVTCVISRESLWVIPADSSEK